MTVLSKSIRRVSPKSIRYAAVGTPYTSIHIGVPKESFQGENRVALTPEGVGKLKKLNFNVQIESNAGANAGFSDAAYVEAGATLSNDIWNSDMILKGEFIDFKNNQVKFDYFYGLKNPENVEIFHMKILKNNEIFEYDLKCWNFSLVKYSTEHLNSRRSLVYMS
jgi:hypothetical protein